MTLDERAEAALEERRAGQGYTAFSQTPYLDADEEFRAGYLAACEETATAPGADLQQQIQQAQERLDRANADRRLAVRFVTMGIVPAAVYGGQVTLQEGDAERLLALLEERAARADGG